MKNTFRYLVSILAGAIALAACQQESAPLGTKISVNPTTITVAGQNAEDQTVTVTADGDWIAVVPSWITANPAVRKFSLLTTCEHEKVKRMPPG